MERETESFMSMAVAAIAGAALLALTLIIVTNSKQMYRNEQENQDTKAMIAARSDLMQLTTRGTATGNDISAFILKRTGEFFYAVNNNGTRYLLADVVNELPGMSTEGDVRNGYIAEVTATGLNGQTWKEWQYFNTAPAGISSIGLGDFQWAGGETSAGVTMNVFTFSDGTSHAYAQVLKRWTEDYLGHTVFRDTLAEDYKVCPILVGDDIVGFYFTNEF